jgi:hypothetical protein
MNKSYVVASHGLLLCVVQSPAANAQVQTTGTPGSPSATTTIDGAQLPALPPRFGGKIERRFRLDLARCPPMMFNGPDRGLLDRFCDR